MKIVYNKGDLLGPYKIYFIEELFKETDKKHRFGKFICPDCNKPIMVARIDQVKSGHSRRCQNCSQKIKLEWNKTGLARKKDLTGRKFGHLTVICDDGSRQYWFPPDGKRRSEIMWLCECDCESHSRIHVSSSHLTSGHTTSCGCNVSKGEDKVGKILYNNHIEFERQKKFNGCENPKTGYSLSFDFYLPRYNCCIEYDGEQHFKWHNHKNGWNTKQQVVDTQFLDGIKNQYCKDYHIHLIRIPYTDYDKLNDNYILQKIKEAEED